MINSSLPAMSASPDEASGLDTGLSDVAPSNPDPANDAAIRAIIAQLQRTSALPYRDELAARLDLLRTVFNDEGDGEIFSADSLRGMLNFLESAPALPYPSVTLTLGGDTCVTWQNGVDQIFGAHFLDARRVQFGADYPNFLDATQTDQLSGLTTPLALADLISHVHINDWAKQ